MGVVENVTYDLLLCVVSLSVANDPELHAL